jgi:cytochrome c peroxidase
LIERGLDRARTWALGLAFGVALSSPTGAGEPQYVGAEKCKTCHGKELMGDQFSVWLEDPHHRAFETLKSEESARIAQQRGLTKPPHEADECLPCHVTAYGVPPLRIAHELDPADGVQCESCHGPGREYRKKKIMSDREQALAKGLWDVGQDPSICTGCHNPESPTFDAKRYELPDGTHAGFDFEQATARIVHAIPEDVKGRYLEIEARLKKERDAAER